jgi:hypothetical protein
METVRQGSVDAMAWQPDGDFLAWSSAVGVKIYDCRKSQIISHISRPESWRADMRCQLCWVNSFKLLVGWGNSVRVAEVRSRATQVSEAFPCRCGPICLRCNYATPVFVKK